MLDIDEAASYEAWKVDKLTTATDLSIRAYNAEMGALAAAWEEGVRRAEPDPARVAELLEKNPYRAAGMRGESR